MRRDCTILALDVVSDHMMLTYSWVPKMANNRATIIATLYRFAINLVPRGHETRLALLGVPSLAISTSAGKYFGYQQE
jgi:hypothetical protein